VLYSKNSKQIHVATVTFRNRFIYASFKQVFVYTSIQLQVFKKTFSNLRSPQKMSPYNYLCNQCLSPLKLWVRTTSMARCTRYSIMWYSLSV